MTRPRPLVLVVLDGFGLRTDVDNNAVELANAPRWRQLLANYPHTSISASGPDVGLPEGQFGNSEVGHMNLGAGRIAQMDISRIDCAVADRSLAKNDEIARAITIAKQNKGRLHLLGLVSDGGVHSSIEHLFALIDQAHEAGVSVVVHAFLDGRDTPPQSAKKYLEQLETQLSGKGIIGTVTGRYWAMDRDKRWERVERAYRAIVQAQAPRVESAIAGLQASYEAGKNDEFVEPVIVGQYQGAIKTADTALFFNFRADRAREISLALTGANFPPFRTPCPESICALRLYDRIRPQT